MCWPDDYDLDGDLADSAADVEGERRISAFHRILAGEIP